jgi:fumarate reductase flavoprotein subunit
MDCDLVVVGAGGSGLVAAVKTFDLTGAKVIVLEKSRKPGGATYFGTGMGEGGPILDSAWQKEQGWTVNAEQDITGQFFDWICTKGDRNAIFHLAKRQEGESGIGAISIVRRTEKYKDLPDPSIGPGKMGSWTVNALTAACKKQGITILTETPARKLLTDKNGHVVGLLADAKEGMILINCKAVILASGGYGANKEKCKKYYPKFFSGGKIHSLCPPYDTGDGMDMAEEIGGYIDPTIRSTSFPGGFMGDGANHHPYCYNVGNLAGRGLTVNLLGKRFAGSGGGGPMGGSGTSGLENEPEGLVYSITDSEQIESSGKQQESRFSAGGQMGGSVKKDANGQVIETIEAKAAKLWREELEYEIAIDEAGASGNHTKRANTLVELALKMKIDPKAFVETVEEYNKSIESNKGGGSGGMMMGGPGGGSSKPIKTPPFYAVIGHRWSQCSKGRNGVAVNSKFQALTAKGETITGLYAVGDGCTIFGGLNLNINQGPSGNEGVLSRTEAYLKSKSKSQSSQGSGIMAMGAPGGGGAPATGGASGGPGGGMPSRAQGGQGGGQASMQSGPPGSQGGPGGGMPGMMGAMSERIDFKTDEGNPCGGLGPAFISGYYAAKYVSEFLKKA